MRVGVWTTGHPIADTVAHAMMAGLDNAGLNKYGDVNIGYGILRGMASVFGECDRRGLPWFNVDNGYFNPGHFSGQYRVSLRGTQFTDNLTLGKPYDGDLATWRGFDWSKPVLVCPPTLEVDAFFELGAWVDSLPESYVIRHKGDTAPIDFLDYNYVLTFNSSMGWKALMAGIPCVSDPQYSAIGSRYSKILLENLSEAQYVDREHLLGEMASRQMTLQEMREGKLWRLIKKTMCLSDTTTESRLDLMSQPIVLRNEHDHL